MNNENRIRLVNIGKVNGTWSLSKANRFPSAASDHKAEASYIPTSLVTRSVAISSGKRWALNITKDSETPLPNIYTLKGAIEKTKGRSFGHRISLKVDNGVPGPGSYNITLPQSKSPKFSLKSKHRDFTPIKSPSPYSYSPNHSITFKSTAWQVSFGFGDREFLKNPETDTPGPNAYRLPSQFDKYRKPFGQTVIGNFSLQ